MGLVVMGVRRGVGWISRSSRFLRVGWRARRATRAIEVQVEKRPSHRPRRPWRSTRRNSAGNTRPSYSGGLDRELNIQLLMTYG